MAISEVVKAVLNSTTQWAEANKRRDAAAVLELIVNSDELRHV